MKPSTTGRAAVWTTAISVSGAVPHAAPIALGSAVVYEAFDLLRARSHRISVVTYLRMAGANTYLDVGPSPVTPALVIHVESPGLPRPDDKEGAQPVAAADELPPASAVSDPADFCIKQRKDWLAYAVTRTRSWSNAEDAVSHAVQRIYEHYAEHGTLCPDGYDPVAWSKTVIRNFIIDHFKAAKRRRELLCAFTPLQEFRAPDVADHVTDQIMARKALVFTALLSDRDHMIAVMRYVDGLEPVEIAEQLGMNPGTVRTSLHRTLKKMRTEFGVTEPRRIFKEEKAT